MNKTAVALAGNPNVGKSTVFNALTGMNQHTGNWPGKTVEGAKGYFKSRKKSYVLTDTPGTYSLTARSAEEEIARNFICFGKADAVVVVCDATSLERSMNLVLQTLEITDNVVVCVNLIDRAKKQNIKTDLNLISRRLGVPVVGTHARQKKSLKALVDALDEMPNKSKTFKPCYSEPIERAIEVIQNAVDVNCPVSRRWLSLRLLDADESLKAELTANLGADFMNSPSLALAISKAKMILDKADIQPEKIGEQISKKLAQTACEICSSAVTGESGYCKTDRKADRLFAGKITAFPLMLLMLAAVFWLTMVGTNYPSQLLFDLFSKLQKEFGELLACLNIPPWLSDCLELGVFRVPAWVISVMLPPMLIFFPLFSLLEDSGYLPRIAYNLDRPFAKCNSCGKQALTMCMGFGCNAVGVTGCRIIDSPAERLLAVLTNSFVPCNGRFPTMILLITVFLAGNSAGFFSDFLSAAILTAIIVFGVFATFAATKLLSLTVLKGKPSSFILELPSYRRPQIIKTVVRSVIDKTLRILGRAVVVALPAGIIIWLAANITVGEQTLLLRFAQFLNPIAEILGFDGVVLAAFILGFPANETVMPIIIMAYGSLGALPDIGGTAEIGALLAANGWNRSTAVCVILFSLMHWPCSTTLMTVKKETGSLKYTVLAAVLPTAMGAAVCAAAAAIMRYVGFC